MNQRRTLPSDDQASSELAWLAWQYVSGEMNSDESAAFEDRLAREDAAGQAAREAAAQMVELSEAVALAEALAPAGAGAASVAGRTLGDQARRPRWSARSAALSGTWMAIGAAVAVAAIGLWQPGLFTPENRPLADQRLPHELASYWADLPDNFEEEELAEEEELDGSEDELVVDLVEGASAEASPEGVPSWLLSALESDDSEKEHN